MSRTLQQIEKEIVTIKRLITQRGRDADCSDLEKKLNALKTRASTILHRMRKPTR